MAAIPLAVRPGVHNGRMKVFISSVIGNFGAFRTAAQDSVETLGHQILRAEDFPAGVGTPQQACLAGVRDADLVLLLLGDKYGEVQTSGLSATHEEYREAKERVPVLVFVQSSDTREPAQQGFLDEVEAWTTGHFRAAFSDVNELAKAVTRALHGYELSTAAGPADTQGLLERAEALLAGPGHRSTAPSITLAVAAGPEQSVLRPAELRDVTLARDIQRDALFGDHAVLDSSEGTESTVTAEGLVLQQRAGEILITSAGSVRITLPAMSHPTDRLSVISSLIDEDVTSAVARALTFAAWLLDRIDPLERLTDVVPVVELAGAGYLPWRTRAEAAASPNSATMGSGSDRAVVALNPARRHRQALTHDAGRIAEDLTVLLRQEHSH